MTEPVDWAARLEQLSEDAYFKDDIADLRAAAAEIRRLQGQLDLTRRDWEWWKTDRDKERQRAERAEAEVRRLLNALPEALNAAERAAWARSWKRLQAARKAIKAQFGIEVHGNPALDGAALATTRPTKETSHE